MIRIRSLLALHLLLAASSAALVVASSARFPPEDAAPPDVVDVDVEEDSVTLRHFTAYPSTMTCASDDHALPFNNQIRGVNLGGWLVLEPWITPTLFYQFLGSGQGEVAMDHYSFCDVLGPEEGNRQLRRHWETWVTRDLIGELARGGGAVNSLRVPVGDFMFQPYGPYGEQHSYIM